MCFAVANVISKFVFSSLSSLFLWTRLTTILQMHCDLRPPKPRQFFSALITTPCQVWNRWTCLLPYYSILAADILLYAVTLTFDLRHWTLAVYHVWRDETLYQIWMQSSNPRQSYCDSVCDLMTLNIALRVALGSGIIFTKFDLRQLIRAWIITFLCWYVMLCCDIDLWPIDLQVHGTSSITWSKSVRNLSEIEQSPAELLIIWQIFARIMSRSDLNLWPLDLEILQHFGFHAFKLCTKFEWNRIFHGWVIDDLARFRVQF